MSLSIQDAIQNIMDQVASEQKKFTLPVLESGPSSEPQQIPCQVRAWFLAYRWHLLSVPPSRWPQGCPLEGVLSEKASILPWSSILVTWPPPKAPSPNTITLGFRFQACKCWGDIHMLGNTKWQWFLSLVCSRELEIDICTKLLPASWW